MLTVTLIINLDKPMLGTGARLSGVYTVSGGGVDVAGRLHPLPGPAPPQYYC